MNQVSDFVEPSMMQKLEEWLLSRRDGSGGFLRSDQALDSFGRAPENITNAYIVWSLTSSGNANLNLTKEIEKLIKDADKLVALGMKDSYYMALLSAVLYNVNRTQEAQKYADIITDSQLDIGEVADTWTSITTSSGLNLHLETTAMAVLAWLNDQNRYGPNIERAIEYIVAKVKLGGYGSTQATILSLKAITKYMNNFVSINGNGNFVLRVNG